MRKKKLVTSAGTKRKRGRDDKAVDTLTFDVDLEDTILDEEGNTLNADEEALADTQLADVDEATTAKDALHPDQVAHDNAVARSMHDLAVKSMAEEFSIVIPARQTADAEKVIPKV